MDIEELRNFCLGLPGTTEDIKWGDNLTFLVAGKIFCLADLTPPLRVTFKVREELFDELTQDEAIDQAPYFAKRKWVTVNSSTAFSDEIWKQHLTQAYELVVEGLPKKSREMLKGI